MTSKAKLQQSLSKLRSLLRDQPPAGQAGFEGLIATLVAAATGLQIRLAKSGSQFGRDASSARGPFTIAIETKRYDSKLRLETLAGKVALAGFSLGGDTDLWVVGATSEAGDDVVKKVSAIADTYGISVVFLDWSPHMIPPLAVLLALDLEATEAWFKTNSPQTDAVLLRSLLDAISKSDPFTAAEQTLRASLSAAEVGVSALQSKNRIWLRKRWGDMIPSRQEFGQIVTPLDPTKKVLMGRTERLKIAARIKVSQNPKVVVVLGDEGVGKTWLVADWWLTSEHQPILIPILGKAVDLLESHDPIGSLARILELHYPAAGIDSDGWRRRLVRWFEREKSALAHPWFVVALDGLNEHPNVPWADVLVAFGRVVAKAGGVLLVTSRPAFWRREIVERLVDPLEIVEAHISGYALDEVESLLGSSGVSSATIPQRLKVFLQNPRICSVALNLLDRLAGTPNELTVERLQLEYWKQRLKERGNLVQHTANDFNNVLKAHAKEWLAHPQRQFQLDEWAQKSSVLKRNPSADVVRDLSDIVEGHFMQASSQDENSYEFRPQALPFALGLLLAHEVRNLGDTATSTAVEAIDSIIEPIRSFDLTSQIVASAFGLSCLEKHFPPAGSKALLSSWASLQNLDQRALEVVFPYTIFCPEIFCDLLAQFHEIEQYYPQEQTLAEFLFRSAEHPNVRPVLNTRILAWFGFWCKKARPFTNRDEPNSDRDSVAKCLAALTQAEEENFRSLCKEVTTPSAAHMDKNAAFQLLSGRQFHLASGIWAWCLAQAVAGDYLNASEELQWAIRLNPVDWSATANAMRTLVSSVAFGSSEPFRQAASTAWRLLGDLDSEAQAETLTGPRRAPESRSRATTFCNVNPHDPEASICDNLSNSVSIVESLSVASLRVNRFSTKEDHDLKYATPGLARFSVLPLIEKIRELVASIGMRSGMALFALCCDDLPEYSPILDDPSIRALESRLDSLTEENVDWSLAENHVVVNHMLMAIFPHIDAPAQLQHLLKVPHSAHLFLKIQGTMKPLSSEQLDGALRDAKASNNGWATDRILFMVSANPIDYSPFARSVIISQLESRSTLSRNGGYDLIRRSSDPTLDDLVISQATKDPIVPEGDEDFYRAQAIAQAVIRANRPELLPIVQPQHRQTVASQLGGDAIESVAIEIQNSLHRLLQPIAAVGESQSPVFIGSTPDGLMQRISVSDDEGVTDLGSLLFQLSDSDERSKKFEESQMKRIAQHAEFQKRLSAEGADSFLHVPSHRYMLHLVDRCPDRVENWLRSILARPFRNVLHQVFNLGAALAGAYARIDGDLSAEVLRHLQGDEPFFKIVSDDEDISLFLSAVFSDSSSPRMSDFRERYVEQASNDAELALCARAASVCGSQQWLLSYIDKHHLAENPAMQARAMILAGFCYPEEDLTYVFAGDRKTGFLGQVRTFALKQRTHSVWAKHWCVSAIRSESTVDFWRFAQLAEGVADMRFTRCFENLPSCRNHVPFEPDVYERLRKAAENRHKKRKDTLFGLKAPSDRISWALQVALARSATLSH